MLSKPRLISVIMMTATEVIRPGMIPKGMPTMRLKTARKKREKHSHILINFRLKSFTRITFLWELSSD